MNAHDVDQNGSEIKPGESLYTPEWRDLSRTLSLTERGLAVSLLVLMFLRGWRSIHELPSNTELSVALGCGSMLVLRLRARLTAQGDVFDAQARRVARWPSWIIQEFTP